MDKYINYVHVGNFLVLSVNGIQVCCTVLIYQLAMFGPVYFVPSSPTILLADIYSTLRDWYLINLLSSGFSDKSVLAIIVNNVTVIIINIIIIIIHYHNEVTHTHTHTHTQTHTHTHTHTHIYIYIYIIDSSHNGFKLLRVDFI